MSDTARVTVSVSGSEGRTYPAGVRAMDVATDMDTTAAQQAVAVRINGELRDLTTALTGDVDLRLVMPDEEDGLGIMRHSVAHVMARAVMRLYENVRLAFGPTIENGFYYDFDVPDPIKDEDLPRIEQEMHAIITENEPFERLCVSVAEARQLFQDLNQTYKVEHIDDLADQETISLYRQGEFVDLCRGPHLPQPGRAGAFKLLNVAGAYWKNDASRPQLQRIYGTAWATQQALDAHLQKREEARKRDHRMLGRQLDLFSMSDELGSGLVLWHPKLAMVRHLIEAWWRDEHLKRGYSLVYTPHIASERVFVRSGHLEMYSDLMFPGMDDDGQAYRLKPMNCPAHIMIYQSRTRSYRDLPIRYFEMGTVYRNEASGTMHGMMRVRGFTQDDAHIFCTREQLADEVAGVLELTDVMMRTFGYAYTATLSTRPEKHLGTVEEWESATQALRQALQQSGLSYTVDEGGGAFYAPKIDIHLTDCMGRSWQVPTIQVDLNLPKRFHCVYVDADNAEHEVVMIHRAILGALERSVGIFIEHCGGAFPMWLAPTQARVLPVSEKVADYADQVVRQLAEAGLRVEPDHRSEKLGHKIRDAQLEKVPYMLIVGEKEKQAGTVSLRDRIEGDRGERAIGDVIELFSQEVASRAIRQAF